MIIKVCGLKFPENHNSLGALEMDMIGINFYKPSKRYIGDEKLAIIKGQLRVGVFVESTKEVILNAIDKHKLDFAQLHGDEAVERCQHIQKYIPIIKVFRISPEFNWSSTEAFEFADYFLFDTATEKFGGSGKKFDWNYLSNYRGSTPFLLSGGISPEDADRILSIDHPQFKGIDINSKFEISPGIKDIKKVEYFIKEIRK